MIGQRGDNGSPPLAQARAPDIGPSPTRGFLFADLRDYTSFVEARGASQAAALLERYRAVVRAAVSRYQGSEIKTEGDSFYVVFPAVSQAVQCGVAIVGRSEEATDSTIGPISVGVGIHAGETVETPDGYVGTPVNIAARICSLAGPGEVLVSDTVRALTQTVLPVAFEPRGRRLLKGVGEPVALFAVFTEDRAATRRQIQRRARQRRRLLWGAVAATTMAGAFGAGAFWLLRPPPSLPAGPWKIGVLVPRGEVAEGYQATLNGAELAVNEANAAGGVGGSPLVVEVKDETAEAGAASLAEAFVNDPRVIAVIGPSSSGNAEFVIPVTNEAGLLECSPAATAPFLTKPRFGAGDLRSPAPDRINFLRLAPSDDIQGVAAAFFAYTDLGIRAVLVIDDTSEFGGVDAANNFQRAFENLRGSVTRRALNPGYGDAEVAAVLAPLTSPTSGPPIGAVYFGGLTETGAVEVRQAMIAAGFASTPFLTWEAQINGTGADEDSFINLAGGAAAGSFATESSIAPHTHDFEVRYRSAYGSEPDLYSGAAFACVQVVLSALEAVAAQGPSAAQLREAVRASAVRPGQRYATVLGSTGFDQNGDSIAQFVTIFRVDMGANGGVGDWIFLKQADYGPAP
jgi:branched-chain amino acid transport system substrate-binding protein